jgi:hypothetical protein
MLNSSIASPVHPALLLDDCADRIAREMWLMTQFSPGVIFPPWLSMLIAYGMNNRPIGGRCSETLFHRIDHQHPVYLLFVRVRHEMNWSYRM